MRGLPYAVNRRETPTNTGHTRVSVALKTIRSKLDNEKQKQT